MLPTINPTKTQAWRKLTIFSENTYLLKDLFTKNPHRFDDFHIKTDSFLFDFSKNRIDQQVLKELLHLAEECQLPEAISIFFSGKKINHTEQRAVMHMALRDFTSTKIEIDGLDVLPDIRRVRKQMQDFSDKIIEGTYLGFTGKKITDVVNIGIGGSDLGPKMVCNALKYYKNHLNIHFVSNLDSQHLSETLLQLNPETTLFIIASKTFTTQETMTNAFSARDWFLSFAHQKDVARHFVALSSNTQAVQKFGITAQHTFEFWDWVGGRYSLWSAIGLSICLAVGYPHFESLLKGAELIDKDLKTKKLNENTSVIMALIGIWNRNFLNCPTQAVLAYNQYLDKFAAFLQQTDMESNGKNRDRNGNKVNYSTGAILWGESGTNGQHAFYQHMHQGTDCVACDFIAFAKSNRPLNHHQDLLMSHFFAQTKALAFGKPKEEVMQEMTDNPQNKEELPYKIFEGNTPSNSFLFKELTPHTLGQMIALYEHKIFVQGVIWNLFSFDQWGVELGKTLAQKILPELSKQDHCTSFDSSSNALINYYKLHK